MWIRDPLAHQRPGSDLGLGNRIAAIGALHLDTTSPGLTIGTGMHVEMTLGIKDLRDCWNSVLCRPARCAVSRRLRCCGVAVALIGYGCSSPCERNWTSQTFQSPDRLWTAVVYEEACDRGLFSEFKRIVELRRADEASGTPVLFPEGQWDGREDVRLRWLEPDVLEVSVPNRTALSYRVREHGLVKMNLRVFGGQVVARPFATVAFPK